MRLSVLTKAFWAVAMALAPVVQAQNEVTGKPKEQPAAAATPDFGKDVLPIFNQKCHQCHGGIHQQHGLDLRMQESILKGGKGGPAVSPGAAESSLLWKMIASDQMPKTNLKLTDAEKAVIRRWIEGGAKPGAAETVAVAAGKKSRAVAEVVVDIDREIDARLAAAKVRPAPRADDGEFLRRAYLDVIGRVPSLAEAQAFLDSTATDKRARLIDELLARPEYGRHFATVWTNIILYHAVNPDIPKTAPFEDWMAEKLNAQAGWDAIIREMLSAVTEEKDKKNYPAPIWYFFFTGDNAGRTDTITATSNTAQIFLGLGLQCAECHDHPFQKWKQADYWGMAAYFARLSYGGPSPKLIDLPLDGKNKGFSPVVSIFSPEALNRGKRVPARFPGGAEFQPVEGNNLLRRAFANWLTAPDNPYFARTYVNRMWGHFFGQGFVNSYTDFNDTNPPSHPRLLQLLAGELVASGFDHKHLIRCIGNSQAYQRSGRRPNEFKSDEPLFAFMASKVLGPEMYHDSLCITLGVSELSPVIAPAAKGKVPAMTGREQFVKFFRGLVGTIDNTEYLSGVPQALRLMNQTDFNGGGPLVEQLMKEHAQPEAVIEQLFLAAYARRPRADELKETLAYCKTQKSAREAYNGVLWVLLNSTEYRLYH